MKRLFVVTLLLIIALLFASCNSYDVEGKPEVAANPAKQVFAYYPWGAGEEITDPIEDPDKDENPVNDEDPVDEPDEDEIIDVDDDVIEPVDEDDEISDESTDDETVITLLSDGNVQPELGQLESTNQSQEFEVINRGVTGELKIRKINLLDPKFRLISEENGHPQAYRDLFKIQISKTEKGITKPGFNDKTLSFDNTDAEEGEYIAPLCPLDIDNASKCKSFDEKEYNTRFRILLTYNQNAAERLMQNPPQETEYNPQTGQDDLKFRVSGDFWIEVCTNDPTKEKSDTCGPNATSYLIQVTRQPNPPPKPLIKVDYMNTVGGPGSYRNIRDRVSLNLSRTCVSDPDNPSQCLANWEQRYYIKYKWEMRESPTPFLPESQLRLPDTSGLPGQWIPDSGRDNPKRAEFTGLMVTPRRYADANPDYSESRCTECGNEPTDDTDEFFANKLSEFLSCRQRFCEKNRTRFYKINIQAETVDKDTDLVSETADLTAVPKIIPQARVIAQLTWDKGYKTETEAASDTPGTKIDLDLHLIKRTSLEAQESERNWPIKEGLMCTYEIPEGWDMNCFDPENEKYCRHDDCYFADQGAEKVGLQETIAWNATYDYDNQHGGGNFESPEVIGLGPIEKEGALHIYDDEYIVVVGYSYCQTNNMPGYDTCCNPALPGCTGKGEAYEVNARVDIIVDGVDAPRSARTISGTEVRPADKYSVTSREFVIRPEEWHVVSVIKWDNTLPPPETNPEYKGDAIVADVPMPDHDIESNASGYKRCKFHVSHCELVPIWIPEDYYSFVEALNTDSVNKIAECY